MWKVFIGFAMIILLSNCEEPSKLIDLANLTGGKVRRIEVGVTTKPELIKMFGPPQVDNPTEASWSEDDTTHPELAMRVANHFLELNGHRTLIVKFSPSNVVTSCQMDVIGKVNIDKKRYYCSEVPGL
jgi:hypothetical protein